MKEIELKILNIDKAKTKEKLLSLGAKITSEPKFFDEIYFAAPQELENTRKYSSFRLRQEGNTAKLTIKEKKTDQQYNIREETEIKVSDFDKTQKMIKLLGFKVFRKRQKIREEYSIDDAKIVIDEYPGMSPYIEIESSTKEALNELLKLLEFPLESTTNKTASEIIKNQGLDPNNLVLKEKPVI